MKNYGYTTATLEEFYNAHEDTNLITLPARAISELKDAQSKADQVTQTLKKYLINARQAQTNAKIVESLLG